jgi:phosphoribosyl 1,2-cyclic phosphate phosphodiesterase
MNAVFDTPEEISVELERWAVDSVDNAFYSHWHPDHTSGMRIFEQLNMDWISDRPKKTTTVYLPPNVQSDFKTHIGLMERLGNLAEMKLVTIRTMANGHNIDLGGFKVQCREMANPSLYAYLLEENGKRVLLALDDTFRWIPPQDLRGVDLAVLETGWFERTPDGLVLATRDSPVARDEASFDETIEKVRKIGAERTILTHIEEISQRTYDDLKRLEAEYSDLNVTFAYDGLTVEA